MRKSSETGRSRPTKRSRPGDPLSPIGLNARSSPLVCPEVIVTATSRPGRGRPASLSRAGLSAPADHPVLERAVVEVPSFHRREGSLGQRRPLRHRVGERDSSRPPPPTARHHPPRGATCSRTGVSAASPNSCRFARW
jgi:hypothetical protein